jgi:hypothetical protein
LFLLARLTIILCSQVGRRLPTLAGFTATMPLTGLIVMLWLYTDTPGDYDLMVHDIKGALWGTLPSILFLLYWSLDFDSKKHWSLDR